MLARCADAPRVRRCTRARAPLHGQSVLLRADGDARLVDDVPRGQLDLQRRLGRQAAEDRGELVPQGEGRQVDRDLRPRQQGVDGRRVRAKPLPRQREVPR